MKRLINRILISLKLLNPKTWNPPEFEVKLLDTAYMKVFKPTIEYINSLSNGGYYKTKLSFVDREGQSHESGFEVTIVSDPEPGLKFQILLPDVLNIGSVEYKESYGLDKELVVSNKSTTLIIPENAVVDFKTKYPSKPQILNGRFARVLTSKDYKQRSFCRFIIPTLEKDMMYPSGILECEENHMKFDMPFWDRQQTLLGIPMMTTKGMYVELTIKDRNYHFYGLEQLNSIVIDSIEETTTTEFQEVVYAIRLCFAFLSGKFHKKESVILASSKNDFSEIDFMDYCVEENSIFTENQIVNPTFFFGQYSEQSEEIQAEWKPYHKPFDTEVFSSMCEKVIDSPEFMRSLELVVNVGTITDPVQKGALYSVSIETLTEIIRTENEEAFKPIDNQDIWKELQKDFQANLDKHKAKIKEEGYSVLSRKIVNLNSPTNRVKLEKPFKIVEIELSEADKESLGKRNDYLHGGQPRDEGWEIESKLNALKLHYLIGMLVLKYFKYSGHYISLPGWHLLQDPETKRIIQNLDFNEVKETMRKIEEEDLKTVDQIEHAKSIIQDFYKFNKASLEINEIIKII